MKKYSYKSIGNKLIAIFIVLYGIYLLGYLGLQQNSIGSTYLVLNLIISLIYIIAGLFLYRGQFWARWTLVGVLLILLVLHIPGIFFGKVRSLIFTSIEILILILLLRKTNKK